MHKKDTMISLLLFGMEEFKINRDWRNMERVPHCKQNYGNGVNPNFQCDSNNADATGSRIMYMIHSSTAH